MNYGFKIQKIIAFYLLILLMLLVQGASSASQVVSCNNSDSFDEIVVSSDTTTEFFFDFDELLVEPDSEFMTCCNLFNPNISVSQPFEYYKYKGTRQFTSLVFIFETDLPPPPQSTCQKD